MPHNWASAECVRYLRHRLLLEDGSRMRLLAGMIPANFHSREVLRLENTPSRFGRVSLQLEPLSTQKGWKLDANIEPAQRAESVELPVSVAGQSFERIANAKFKVKGRKLTIDLEATKWTAYWR